MSWNDRVVWSEGQFLLPQMFQQQERYLEHVMHYRSLPLTPFFWGFSHYNIDGEALNIGKLILKEASGIFPDGTPFNAPDHTPLPPPLTILPEHLNQQICLAVPVRAPNSEETTFDNNPESLARFSVHEHDIRDANSLGRGAQLLQLSHLRLRLLPEKAVTGAWIGLPLTRITGLNPDGRIDIDHDLIPPIINYQASSLMCTWLSWINDLIRMRADSLAERLTGSDNHGHEAAEVSDYLLLQILNRFEPLLIHLAKTPLAPEVLYRYLSELAGELSTYVRPQTRRPAEYKEYKHLTPYAGLKSLVDEVQFLLNAVLIRGAQRIELKEGDLRHPECGGGSFRSCRFQHAGTGDKGFNADRCATATFCRPDQNRAIRSPAGTDPLASAGAGFAGFACTTAPNPVSGRIHLLRHPPRGSIVGTHCPLRRDGHAYRRGISGAGDRTVGSAR